MQIELVETFLDLVETRSFNRTAERLGVTQSTVSGRVAALERAVGRRLFTRSRAGTEPTLAGRRFVAHARGLRHDWTEAVRVAQSTGDVARSVRLGLQIDLAEGHIGDWGAEFRRMLPDTAFYMELDLSQQMCSDLVAGIIDLAVLYTPRPAPDLHFESVGEVRFRMISSDGPERAALSPARYIRANYSDAFDQQHRQLFPELSPAPLSCGHNTAIIGLLNRLGGAGYVLEASAASLVASGRYHFVEGVPAIPQSVYAAVHVRQRHAHVHRQLVGAIRRHFA